jgi:hypothetical protein
MTVWADIAGFEGVYQISDQGELRSLDREIQNKGSGGKYLMNGQTLKPRKDADGYLVTDLWKAGKKTTVKLHRLAAQAFLPTPEAGHVVDHINGKRDDNRLENLRWVSQSQNLYNRRLSAGASGVIGVRFRDGKKNPWQAYITVDGRFKSLGHFPTKQQAANARQEAMKGIRHAA